jgi:hypothetical protein
MSDIEECEEFIVKTSPGFWQRHRYNVVFAVFGTGIAFMIISLFLFYAGVYNRRSPDLHDALVFSAVGILVFGGVLTIVTRSVIYCWERQS